MAVLMITSSLVITPIVVNADTAVSLESYVLDFWADPENTLTQADIDAYSSGTNTTLVGGVALHKRTSSSNYYLFLPSNADPTNLKVWFTASSCTVDGTTVTNGEATDVFKDIATPGTSKTYTVKLGSSSYTVVAMKSSDVGAIYIDTTSGSLSTITSSDHDTYEDGTILVVDENGKIEYDGIMDKMSGRGNGTWDTGNDKNPYNFNLNKATSLLDMSKSRKWTLLANAGDSTLLKNQITYDFAKYIGVPNQVICKPVDLYVNQMYLGSYQLSERVEIRSSRIDIIDAYENLELANPSTDLSTLSASGTYNSSGSKATTSALTKIEACTVGNRRYTTGLTNPADITGGYLYELEISNRWIEENNGFCAYNRQGWVIKSADVATPEMVEYSYNLLYALGGSVYNGGVVPSASVTTNCSSLSSTITKGAKSITNPAPIAEYQGKKWSDFLDADSAALYYWTQEYFKNMDSSTSSTYFFKDSDSIDGKLYAGPVWDMDNAICYNSSASRWGYSYTSADGWYTKNARIYRWRSNDSTMTYSSDSYSPLNFYAALATNCSDFWALAENKWYSTIEPATQILLGNATDPTGTLKSTAQYAQTIKNSATMNLVRFGSDSTYDNATITSGVNTWFTNRNTFINGEISQIPIANAAVSVPSASYTGQPIEPEFTLAYGGAVLQEGVDYEITSYANNINAGTGTINVAGLGRFTGTTAINFSISANSLTGGSATIPSIAYEGDELSVEVKDLNGNVIKTGLTYQWYNNGSAVSGATADEYTVATGDTNVTVKVSGDGKNVSTLSITSNACTIRQGDRPAGFTQTIAAWDYDYEADKDVFDTTDYVYPATSGANQSVSSMTGSVDASNDACIKWSGESDLYVNGDYSSQAPIMGTSKADGLAWGEYPYFETVTSTENYENIQFSAKIGGTNKAPRDWKLQYSLDGTSWSDVAGATYSITNNKELEQAFNMVSLPQECFDQETLYIRIVASADVSIDGSATIINQLSGDAAVNNVAIYGASTLVVTELSAPTMSTTANRADVATFYSDEYITLTDTNGGADIYYSIDGASYVLYTGPFNPFSADAKIGDQVTVSAYATFDGVKSATVSAVGTNAGTALVSYHYDNYTENVINGALYSNGGVYGESGKMTNVLDGTTQVVPMWNADHSAFQLAPDDGLKWTNQSGYYFELSTAGYQDIRFTAKAYTTAFGPSSVSVQYSTDGSNWTTAVSNVELNANGVLEEALFNVSIPNVANLDKAYIRLVTLEDKTQGDSTNASTTLFNNNSSGNLYVNDVVIAGAKSGAPTMPYTNKATNYFGTNGVLKYNSPDGSAMQYKVEFGGKVIAQGEYPQDTGIQLSAIQGFDAYTTSPYTVSVWSDASVVNTRDYYFKGSTIVAFDYNSSNYPSCASADGLSVANSSGTNVGTLAMYPNGVSATPLSYSGTYGVKAEWVSDNKFTSASPLNSANGGYWLIATSTAGFTGVTLNLEQVSSNKAPRDWGVAYSTDGVNYTYVANSNTHAVSNDYIGETVETYSNLALPSACDNQQSLYIKVFINGSDSVDGTSLADAIKGNTGINKIELSGIGEKPPVVYNTLTINTVAQETKGVSGAVAVDAFITINGTQYQTTNGTLTLEFESGTVINADFSANGTTFVDSYTVTLDSDATYTVGVVALDVVADGVINVKDKAQINRTLTGDIKDYYNSIFNNFFGMSEA